MMSGRRKIERWLMKTYGMTEEEAEGAIEYLEETEREALKYFGEKERACNPDLNWELLLSIFFGALASLSFMKWLFSLGSTPKKREEEKKRWEELYF